MLQNPDQVVKSTGADISIHIKDGPGAPLPGLSITDVRVAYLKQDGLAFVGKTLVATEFIDRGYGWYDITFSADELDTEGSLIVKVTPDPAYVGTMQQATKLVYIADSSTAMAGFVQDRAAWIPVLLEVAPNPVGGLVDTDVTLSRFKKPDNSFAAIVLSATNFREILDLGQPTGVYQVYLPSTYFDQIGTAHIHLNGPLFDDMQQPHYIVQANTRRVFVEVLDMDNNDDPVIGAEVAATNLTTNLVEATATTDALGQAMLDLPDGEYRLTLSDGTEIFHENNLQVLIWDPDQNYSDATRAELVCSNPGPYNLQDGDTLQFKMGGGELQTVTFLASAFVAPANLSAATADYLAGILNTQAHSVVASAGGLNNKHLVLTSLVEGAISKVEVVGGTAQSALNFSTDEVVGRDRVRVINSFLLNGASFVPPYPAPDSDTVELTYRVVDLEGRPVRGAEVNITNKFNPGVRASDGVSSVLGRKVLQFFTDADGYLQDLVRGKPRLMKGAQVDVILKGTGIVRAIIVPQIDFTLMDEVEVAEDLFTIQTPNLPPAPRT